MATTAMFFSRSNNVFFAALRLCCLASAVALLVFLALSSDVGPERSSRPPPRPSSQFKGLLEYLKIGISAQQDDEKEITDPTTTPPPLPAGSYKWIEDEAFAAFRMYTDESLNPRNCRPARKMGFVKTHKTASSTIQNILFRHGLHAELNFVLPARGNQLSRGGPDNPYRVEWLDGAEWHSDYMREGMYDVLALHGTWNSTAMNLLLGEDAPKFTILRDPSSAFESVYGYYDLRKKTGLTLKQFIRKLAAGSIQADARYGGNGLSNMAWDLGIATKDFYNQTALARKVSEMDSELDLVLISDLMDESLVLLSHLLCLPLHKMACIKKNARKKDGRQELTAKEVQTLRRHQAADEFIYAVFKGKLEKKIEAFGAERMSSSVRELRRLREEIEAGCGVSGMDNRAAVDTPFHVIKDSVVVYSVREDVEECALMGYSEINLAKVVRERQRQRYHKWKKDNS